MGKKGDLSDFERGMIVGARRAGLSISETNRLPNVTSVLSRRGNEYCVS